MKEAEDRVHRDKMDAVFKRFTKESDYGKLFGLYSSKRFDALSKGTDLRPYR